MTVLDTETGLAVEESPPKPHPEGSTACPDGKRKWYIWRFVSAPPNFPGRGVWHPPGEYHFGKPAVYMVWRLFPERVTICDLSRPDEPPFNEALPAGVNAWFTMAHASSPGPVLLNGRRMPGESPIYPGDQLRIGPFVLEAQGWYHERGR